MTKEEAIAILDSKKESWMETNSSLKTFNVSEIQLNNNELTIGDVPISKKALPKLMYGMGLNGKFMDYTKKQDVDAESFSSTLMNIVTWNGSNKVLAKVEGNTVTKILPCNAPQFFEDGRMLGVIYDDFHGKVEELDGKREISKMDIDCESKTMRISIVNPSSKFSISKEDEWVLGSLLSVGLSEAHYSPYYGRLVCLNGMVDGYKMRSNSISGKNYTEENVKSFIQRGFRKRNLKSEHISNIISEASKTPASLGEFLNFRREYENALGNSYVAVKELNRVFDTSEIKNAYKDNDIFVMSELWKKSALCGMTVYELLNDITNFTTHGNLISNEDAMDINRLASRWFLGMQWDNYDLAPQVNFKKKPAFSNSVLQ